MWLVTKQQKAMLRSYCANEAGLDKSEISIEVDQGGDKAISWLDFSLVDTSDGVAQITLNVYLATDFICSVIVKYQNHGDYTTLSMVGYITTEEHRF